MTSPDGWPCLRETEAGVELEIRVTPNAPRTIPDGLWTGPDGARLKLRVKAPPVEGKANDAIIKWAAHAFGLRLNNVSLLRGEKGRAKTLRLCGINVADASSVLDEICPFDKS